MFAIMPLTPAYGRDYKSQAAVLADWSEGKDFQSVWGKKCSIRDFPAGTEISIRYQKLTKVLRFKSKGVSS